MSQNLYEDDDDCSLEGKILVASPHLDDPYFERSLIYICAHDTSGAIGIMINQKIGMISYSDFMSHGKTHEINEGMKNKKFPLMFGGPVNTDMLIALSLNKKDKIMHLGYNDIAVHTDIGKFFKDLTKKRSSKKFILAKGVSAWESRQLEEEIEENSWFVVAPSLDVVFSQKTKDKWSHVIKTLGIANPHGLVKYSGTA